MLRSEHFLQNKQVLWFFDSVIVFCITVPLEHKCFHIKYYINLSTATIQIFRCPQNPGQMKKHEKGNVWNNARWTDKTEEVRKKFKTKTVVYTIIKVTSKTRNTNKDKTKV